MDIPGITDQPVVRIQGGSWQVLGFCPHFDWTGTEANADAAWERSKHYVQKALCESCDDWACYYHPSKRHGR